MAITRTDLSKPRDNVTSAATAQRVQSQSKPTYNLYKNLADFSFFMPPGWNDESIRLFVQLCWDNLDQLMDLSVDEKSRWIKITNAGILRSYNPLLFTTNNCIELAQCIRQYIKRNKRINNTETFRKFQEDVDALLVFFPPSPEELLPYRWTTEPTYPDKIVIFSGETDMEQELSVPTVQTNNKDSNARVQRKRRSGPSESERQEVPKKIGKVGESISLSAKSKIQRKRRVGGQRSKKLKESLKATKENLKNGSMVYKTKRGKAKEVLGKRTRKQKEGLKATKENVKDGSTAYKRKIAKAREVLGKRTRKQKEVNKEILANKAMKGFAKNVRRDFGKKQADHTFIDGIESGRCSIKKTLGENEGNPTIVKRKRGRPMKIQRALRSDSLPTTIEENCSTFTIYSDQSNVKEKKCDSQTNLSSLATPSFDNDKEAVSNFAPGSVDNELFLIPQIVAMYGLIHPSKGREALQMTSKRMSFDDYVVDLYKQHKKKLGIFTWPQQKMGNFKKQE